MKALLCLLLAAPAAAQRATAPLAVPNANVGAVQGAGFDLEAPELNLDLPQNLDLNLDLGLPSFEGAPEALEAPEIESQSQAQGQSPQAVQSRSAALGALSGLAGQGQDAAQNQPFDASRLFDGGVRNPLADAWDLPTGVAADAYSKALRGVDRGMDKADEAELVEYAYGVARQAGIEVERRIFKIAGESYEGLRIVPDNRGHRVNRLAARSQRNLGITLDYVPRYSANATAAFNDADKRVFLPDFGDRDAYPAVLHEVRHAHYSAALARGVTRLFHLSFFARTPRLGTSPHARYYDRYLSSEELSTYPKTLRHLVLMAKRTKSAEARKGYLSSLWTRIDQYSDILETVDFNLRVLRNAEANKNLSGTKVPAALARERGLKAPRDGSVYEFGLPHVLVHMQLEAEPERTRWQRLTGRQDAQALRVLALKRAILGDLVRDSRAHAEELERLIRASEPDLERIQVLSNKLIDIVNASEARFASDR